MKSKELIRLGIPRGQPMELAMEWAKQAARLGKKKGAIRQIIGKLVADPESYVTHSDLGEVAAAMVTLAEARAAFVPRAEPASYVRFGTDFEQGAVTQMNNACTLPVSVAGALLPDAHQGYGLPIGGVLATEGAVIPYAVGMDVACRMRMTVVDWPTSALVTKEKNLIKAIDRETRFGVGAKFKHRREHGVMDEDWSVSPVTARHKDRAWSQLGTSGSGNHFVEFGTLSLERDDLGLKKGTYLALLSHSGSRGVGGEVARFYSKLAMDRHPELPKELRYLAWLGMHSQEGLEYWLAMELMGKYAAANHQLIHRHIVNYLKAEVVFEVENHHNFAWRETHFGREVIVHRKGATPATRGELGVIPGSMATPGYVVRGRGSAESLQSASHGAGRRMSRTAAKKQFNWHYAKQLLAKKGVKLISAGLDEVPMAYKDIETVMAAQGELVDIVARFDPRIVKMAPGSERPED
ncbi:MAG: RtcB family protein [Proteobacteria bacterium]|nr:RtcB family protein [Pseudomonadota bacterium]